MADLLDAIEGEEPDGPEMLEPVRLSEELTPLMLFTRDGDWANLHFEKDAAVRSDLPCPGERCPLCFLGQPPRKTFLLPVLNLEARAVQVLRVGPARGPGTLATALRPHLHDEDIADKVVWVARAGPTFAASVRPFGERADRCESVVRVFKTAREDGLSLLVAFPEYSAAELAEVDRIRRKLDVRGGYDEAAAGRGD